MLSAFYYTSYMWGRVFCEKTEDLGTRRCGLRRSLASHSLKGPSPKSLASRAPGPQTARAQVQRPQGHCPKAHWAQGLDRSGLPVDALVLVDLVASVMLTLIGPCAWTDGQMDSSSDFLLSSCRMGIAVAYHHLTSDLNCAY